MLFLLAFAFLAGIFTILSPCVLPILPALLSAATNKGRWRPLGIILGLILSFTFFTLSLTAIVNATGLSANALRYAAITLISLFGVVMIFPALSNWFARLTTPIAEVGQQLQSSKQQSGFWGGLLFGCALGLLWTPCAGPILAAVTTLVATQAVGFNTVLITLAYSIGAGIPMFIIAYGGSKIIQSSRYLSTHSEEIRKGFGVLLILTAIAIALHWDTRIQESLATVFPPVQIEDNARVKSELNKLQNISSQDNENNHSQGLQYLGAAPEFVGITAWINSNPLTMKELEGKVVLIDFWTYSCINCLRTLPSIIKWYATYKDRGFVVIGVHTPEFEFEKDKSNVIDATKRLGVEYPVAQDNNYKTWQAYNNHVWPAHYLIDQNGNIRSVHLGEGGYVETENQIRELLALPALDMVDPQQSRRHISPETYLGSARGKSYVTGIHLKQNETANYNYTQTLHYDEVGIKGSWRVDDEKITAESDNCYLDFNFLAKQVYLVLSGSSTMPLEITLDGVSKGSIMVDGDRKYDIVKTDYARHQLSLKIPKGVSAYAFTFGDE